MNLIASHPLTTVRLAMQVDNSIGAIKAGLMIWYLLIPGLRGRTIRKLQKSRKKIAELLTTKYSRDFGTIHDYLEISHEETWAKHYIGRYVVTKPWSFEDSAYWGKITNYTITDNIVSPIEFEIKIDNGEKIAIPKNDYSIVLAEPQHKYISKNGDIVTLIDVEIKKGKLKRFNFSHDGKKLSLRSIGVNISELERQEYWLVYKDGVIQPWSLKNIQITENFATTSFSFGDQSQNEYSFTGNELIISVPPLFHVIKGKNWNVEKTLFNKLRELNEPFILYDKEDFDIGAPCKVNSLSDDIVEFLEGRSTRILSPQKIDAIILYYPFFLINMKKEMGIGNIISLKLMNRGTKTKYIGL
jgi:hypothetical protein